MWDRRSARASARPAVAKLGSLNALGSLAEKIKKGRFKTGKLGGCNATMTELWNAALAA